MKTAATTIEIAIVRNVFKGLGLFGSLKTGVFCRY